MNKEHYRIFSLLLSVFLCFSNLTTPILAEGEEDSEQTSEETLEVVAEEQPEEPDGQEGVQEEIPEETDEPESDPAEEISEELPESEDVPNEVITPAEEEESDSEMLEGETAVKGDRTTYSYVDPDNGFEFFLTSADDGGLEITGYDAHGAEDDTLYIPYSVEGITVTSIGAYALEGAGENIRKLDLDWSGIKIIKEGALKNARFKVVDCTQSELETIESYAFALQGSAMIYLPNTISTLDQNAFHSCSATPCSYLYQNICYLGTEEEWNSIGGNNVSAKVSFVPGGYVPITPYTPGNEAEGVIITKEKEIEFSTPYPIEGCIPPPPDGGGFFYILYTVNNEIEVYSPRDYEYLEWECNYVNGEYFTKIKFDLSSFCEVLAEYSLQLNSQVGDTVGFYIHRNLLEFDCASLYSGDEYFPVNITDVWHFKIAPINTAQYSLQDSFILGKDNWSFSAGKNARGFSDNVTYKLHGRYYDDFVKYLRRGEKNFLQKIINNKKIKKLNKKMKASWGGVCYGMAVIMSLVENGSISISGIPHQVGADCLYNLGLIPRDSDDLTQYITYYYLSQFFDGMSREYRHFTTNFGDFSLFNDFIGVDKNEILRNLVYRLSLGQTVPFVYGFGDTYVPVPMPDLLGITPLTGHTTLATSRHIIDQPISTEALGWAHERRPRSLDSGYIVKIYDENKFDFEYLWISSDFSDYYGELNFCVMAPWSSNLMYFGYVNPDYSIRYSDEEYVRLDNGAQTFARFLYNSKQKIVSTTGKVFEWIYGVVSGDMGLKDLRNICHEFDPDETSSEMIAAFEDDGDWTITSEADSPIVLDVYNQDRFISIYAENADSVDLSLSNGTVDIHGSDVEFYVEISTNLDVTEDCPGHVGISGKGSGTINIHAEDYTVVAESDNLITDVSTITYIDTMIAEEEQDDAYAVNVDGRGSIVTAEKSLVLQNNTSAQIEIELLPAGITAEDLSFTSSNEEVVSVDPMGIITALQEGTSTITISAGEGEYTATIKVSVVGDGIYVKSIDPQPYTGAVIKPELSVYDGANKLTAGKDYTVTYKNNTNAYTLKEGDAGFSAKKAPQATIKASGNYSSTKTVYFTIDPADLTTDEVETLTAAYTGKVQKLSPAVKYKGKTLKKGTDYTVTYPGEGYKEPGIYEITVTGKGNYTGTRTYQMIIGAKDQVNLSKATVTTEKKSYAYDEGNQITPNVTVKSGKKVVDPSLYTVTYGENNTTGKGTVTITGNDLETIGTKTITFTITGKPINKLVKVNAPKSISRGTALTDSVTISTELTEGTDYTVQYPETVNAGKVKVVITGINGYIGTVSKTVTVTPDKITSENTEIFVADAEQMKNGARPEVSVVVNEELLEAGTDYTVSYSNNKKAGTGTVTVKGKGNYSGTLKTSFTITPKDLERTTIDYVNQANSSTKKGSYKTTVVVKDEDGGQLKAGTDYTLKFFDGETEIPASAKANDYLDKPLTVKIFGKGSYTGCIEGTYTVAANNTNLSKAVIKIRNQKYLSGAPVEITGQEQFSKAVMGKTPLTLGEDFAVYEYSNNVNKGTATVIFQGIGSYSGYKKVTYKIGQRSIKEYWGGVVSFLSRLMN